MFRCGVFSLLIHCSSRYGTQRKLYLFVWRTSINFMCVVCICCVQIRTRFQPVQGQSITFCTIQERASLLSPPPSLPVVVVFLFMLLTTRLTFFRFCFFFFFYSSALHFCFCAFRSTLNIRPWTTLSLWFVSTPMLVVVVVTVVLVIVVLRLLCHLPHP